MAIEFNFDPAGVRLAVSGRFTIHHAGEVRQQLRGRSGVVLDLTGVEEMDGAGLQLLLAARRDLSARVAAASDAVVEVLLLTGATDLLEGMA